MTTAHECVFVLHTTKRKPTVCQKGRGYEGGSIKGGHSGSVCVERDGTESWPEMDETVKGQEAIKSLAMKPSESENYVQRASGCGR